MKRSPLCLLLPLLPWLLLLGCNSSSFVAAENLEKLFSDVLSSTVPVEDVLQSFFSNCNKTYGRKAVENLEVEFQKTVSCFTANYNTTTFPELNTTSKEGLPPSIVSLLTSTTFGSIAKKCIKPLITPLEGCLNGDGRRNLGVLTNLADYLFEKEGRRIAGLFRLKDSDCMKPIDDNMCFQQILDIFPQIQSNISVFNKENCRVIREKMECIVQSFRKCSKDAVDTINGMKDIIFKGTRCSAALANEKPSTPKQIRQ